MLFWITYWTEEKPDCFFSFQHWKSSIHCGNSHTSWKRKKQNPSCKKMNCCFHKRLKDRRFVFLFRWGLQQGSAGAIAMYFREDFELSPYDAETPGRTIFYYTPPDYFCAADFDCSVDRQAEPRDYNEDSSYECVNSQCVHRFSEFEIPFYWPPIGTTKRSIHSWKPCCSFGKTSSEFCFFSDKTGPPAFFFVLNAKNELFVAFLFHTTRHGGWNLFF